MAVPELTELQVLKCLAMGATPRAVAEAYRDRRARWLADELKLTRNVVTALARRWGIDRHQYKGEGDRAETVRRPYVRGAAPQGEGDE